MDIEHLKKIPDIAKYADNLIKTTYNTSAVTIMDVLQRATNDDLKLDVYEREVFSVIMQIDSPWVANAVNDTHANWEREYPFANDYVEEYLMALGVAPERFEDNKRALVNALPDHIKSETSPEIYKQYLAVMYLQNGGSCGDTDCDYAEAIFAETSRIIEYSAVVEDALEQGTPSQLASAKATERVAEMYYEDIESNASPRNMQEVDPEKVSIAGKVGNLAGKVIGFKYETASNFEEMFKEGLGDYGEQWAQNREEVKARKEELRRRKEELEHQQALADIEFEAEQKRLKEQQKQQSAMLRNQERMVNNCGYRGPSYRQPTYRNSQNYRYNNMGTYGAYNNFAPQIPPFVIGILVNVVLALISLLVLGKATTVFVGIGLILSSLGFIKQKMNEPNAILTILAGYALAVLAILIKLK